MGSTVAPQFTIEPPDQNKFEIEPPAQDTSKDGFWSHVGQSLRSMAPKDIPSFTDALKQAGVESLGPGYQAVQALHNAATEYAAARERGHGVPYSAAAGASTAVGVSPERMEDAASKGDTAGVLGEAAVPTAMALAPVAGEAVGKVTPSRAAIANALRDESGELKPGIRKAATLAGGGVGGAMGAHSGLEGAVVGAASGAHALPRLVDSLVPDRPTLELSEGPEVPELQRSSRASLKRDQSDQPQSQQSQKSPQSLATIESSSSSSPPAPNLPGGPASFNRPKVPKVGDIADQLVANSTGVKPLAKDVPLNQQGAGPNYAYRVRSQGEEGLPIGGSGSNAAHATTTLEDAQRLAPGRESVTGEPQEIVRFDLNGKDHVRIPRDNGPDWVRMNQPLSESDVQRADVNGNFQEAKPAVPKPEAPAATSGETDPIKVKYPDPAIRQMVRANGENIVQAIGGDKDTMKAVHDLTRVDLRQALVNSGEDMGQTTVSNSKFAGEGSITREAAFNRLLEKGLKPSDIVALAKKVPQATTQ